MFKLLVNFKYNELNENISIVLKYCIIIIELFNSLFNYLINITIKNNIMNKIPYKFLFEV